MRVGDILTRAARRWPERPAWIQDGTVISFNEAEARVNRLANGLIDLGMKQGQRVGLLVNNCYEGLETILASMKVGMAIVPMNARLHVKEIQYLLNNTDATGLVYGGDFSSEVDAIKSALPKLEHYICLGAHGHGSLEYEDLLSSSIQNAPNVSINPEDLAWIFSTSGTTGQPKGAMLSHRNLLSMAQAFLTDINPAKPEDVLLHAAPITHGSGLSMFHHIARGAANAFPGTRRFDPPLIFDAIERYRVTTMFMAPTMINMLVASESKDKYDLSSLHTVVYGGGPMYTEHMLQAIKIFGNIFVQIFGQGEAPMTITTLPKEEHVIEDDPDRLIRLGSAGREVTGVRVAILDEYDHELEVGVTGEIGVKSDLVMSGYLNNPLATSETLRNGWLHTGDLGHLDEKGYLFITDRKNDMIISGGANIYPREVEEVIARHPSVAEVSVFGVPDAVWGESVKAALVLSSDAQATEQEIIDFCRLNMASYKKPQSIDFHETLPKNAYGKVEKNDLRKPYWTKRERNI
ncbi:long-chain fatty acid--CoA ligase [SAR202 cluster bacterium AD-804-J14_MRT_500m]|nr:long-chain fatty acid--CoA ligase [SAR202 cluster bacterium AD-804-J14_MRT_500m]